MIDRLTRLLAERPYLVADGAMGTNLFLRGLQTGDAPELWNVEHPERVADVHRGFVAAGCDIILTNSFGANRHRLKLHKLEGRVRELNRAAAGLAREVADSAGRVVVVGGSIGPTGELLQPLGALGFAEARDAFAEQAAGLAEGGADVLWVETMSAANEVEAAVSGAATTGLPVVATLTFDTNGRTMMGVTPAEAVALAHRLLPRPVAFGSNCGTGPAELVASILGLAKASIAGSDVLVAKGNCGIPQYEDGKITFSGTPELMAEYARLARDAGARVIGACCGSEPRHLAAIVAALKDYSPGPPPDLATVEARLGALTQSTKGEAPVAASQEPRRQRRRRG
ncbi:MAG: betaine--homocysteine S-methyltransferase [Alphaproteobacteria bacterium]|nr:betaine--homocysteine S-methyltransferase [Alphaproteobacteria bacterium]